VLPAGFRHGLSELRLAGQRLDRQRAAASSIATIAVSRVQVKRSRSPCVALLLLATARARVNAAAFLIGRSLSLFIVFAVSYAAGEARGTQHGSDSTAVKVIEILLGAALAFAAARQWRRRDQPRTSSGVTKKFTARLDQLNPWEELPSGSSSSRGP
jgi:Sap, sulfolipid-1-addressing protein